MNEKKHEKRIKEIMRGVVEGDKDIVEALEELKLAMKSPHGDFVMVRMNVGRSEKMRMYVPREFEPFLKGLIKRIAENLGFQIEDKEMNHLMALGKVEIRGEKKLKITIGPVMEV